MQVFSRSLAFTGAALDAAAKDQQVTQQRHAQRGDSASLTSLCKQKQWSQALAKLKALYTRGGGVRPNIIDHNVVGSACGRAKHWPRTVELLHEAVAHAGIEADIVSVGALVAASGGAGIWPAALRCVLNSPVEPNLIVCNAAVSSLQKAASTEERRGPSTPGRAAALGASGKFEASTLWQVAGWLVEGMSDQALEVDATSVNSAISACEKNGAWVPALAMLRGMLHRSVPADTTTFCALISAAEKGLQWEWALWAFEEMRARGLVPDTIALSATISACEKCRRWVQAISCIDEAPSQDIAANTITWNALVSACEKGQQWQRALIFFSGFQGRELADQVTFSAMALMASDSAL
eukprot:TRINITY_DN17075_c0_g1_i3.p1 TRINITY_DN17075_c0_g1~~TRINITY_DN17075_c0_g1_i3.p1  ORF type:complete len:353 (+),score=86.73 TRINITY_DN17075_c0_g1_i3:115-1173(+)